MILPPGSYRRVMVMGPCGSGKSTLARRIGGLLDLPVTHMDQLRHGPGWVERSQVVFEADLLAAAAQPGWVIDGNYFGLSADRLVRADLIVMLDLPRRVTFPRIVRRIVTGYGRVRPDSAPGCPERFDPEFLWFSWRWQANKRPRWLKTVEPYRDKAVQVTRDADVERLMTALSPSKDMK